jgi:hypothetical protein
LEKRIKVRLEKILSHLKHRQEISHYNQELELFKQQLLLEEQGEVMMAVVAVEQVV